MVYEIGRTKSGLRMGFTTGSCAAAAAKAATYMLLSGETIQQVKLMTPKGIELYLDVEKIRQTEKFVESAIRKNSGDEPDQTKGLLDFARVKKERQTTDTAFYEGNLSLEGGVGVGRITHPGLEQKVGQAAINQIPRKMIFDAVQEICLPYGYQSHQAGFSILPVLPYLSSPLHILIFSIIHFFFKIYDRFLIGE